MDDWLRAWLAGQPMPPNTFPKEWLAVALAIAEHWLDHGSYRCALEEWVSVGEADVVTGGLLYSGFCLSGHGDRVLPAPVLVQLLFTEPYPTSTLAVRERMRAFLAQAIRDWIRAHVRCGDSLQVSP